MATRGSDPYRCCPIREYLCQFWPLRVDAQADAVRVVLGIEPKDADAAMGGLEDQVICRQVASVGRGNDIRLDQKEINPVAASPEGPPKR